jgi:tetratricopeptide (TPR) repeat protein
MDHELQQLHENLKKSLADMLGGHDNLRDAMGLDSERVTALALYARELVDQGRLADAQTLLEGLVMLDPQNAYVHTCLGALYMQLKENDAAIAELGYAARLDPTDTAANTHLGELLLERGEFDASADYLRKAIEADPKGEDPFANRARTLAMMVATIAREVQERGPQALDEIRSRVSFISEGNA